MKIHTDTQTTSTEATYEDLLFQQETPNIPIFWGGETNLLQLMESVSGPCCTNAVSSQGFAHVMWLPCRDLMLLLFA